MLHPYNEPLEIWVGAIQKKLVQNQNIKLPAEEHKHQQINQKSKIDATKKNTKYSKNYKVQKYNILHHVPPYTLNTNM